MDQARRRVRPCRVPAAGACEPRRVRVGEHGRRGVGLRVEEPAIVMAQVECASGVKSIEPARRSILSSPRAVVRRPRERRGTAAYPSGNGIERGPGTHVMCRSRASAVTMPQPNPGSARSVAPPVIPRRAPIRAEPSRWQRPSRRGAKRSCRPARRTAPRRGRSRVVRSRRVRCRRASATCRYVSPSRRPRARRGSLTRLPN